MVVLFEWEDFLHDPKKHSLKDCYYHKKRMKLTRDVYQEKKKTSLMVADSISCWATSDTLLMDDKENED